MEKEKLLTHNLENETLSSLEECFPKYAWSAVNIDRFPTVSGYILPEKSELDDEALLKKDEKCFSGHVRTSKYFLKIVNCADLDCCMKPISSYFSVIPACFFSFAYPFGTIIWRLESS
jgi:hypothetical protein